MRLPILAALLALVAFGCSTSGTFTPDEAARICASLATCTPKEFRSSFGGSMQACTTGTTLFPPLPGSLGRSPSITVGSEKAWAQIYKCVLDAHGDCSRAASCLGSTNACEPAGLQRRTCEGEVLAGCTADGKTFSVDCASQGSVCVGVTIIGAPFNECAVARCPASRAELKCRGTAREVCAGDALFLGDCAATGGTCEVVDGGEPRCVSESCAVDFAPRCEDEIAIACVGGFVSRTSCRSNFGATRCEKGLCVPAGSECVEEPDACSGPTLTFCQDGFKRELNCISAGFAGCSAGACVPK